MTSLLTLLDDIAATLDDVSVMTKVALKKTSAIMTDDLAVNSSVVVGVNPDRELPIVKAIFLGSLINKVYCIVGVLLLSTFLPTVLKAVLLFGGIYLCYEGAHKVHEKLFSKHHDRENAPVISEKEKIKGAVRTDLILSVEIIVIAMESIKGTLVEQIIGLCFIGLAASIIIYGLVALLVKIDDLGIYFINKGQVKIGNALVTSMPTMMRGLGIIGTVAMFLVGGGIVAHIFHLPLYAPETLQNLIVGLIVGGISLVLLSGGVKCYYALKGRF